uniref:Protein kinase domain-containing protein n=1 Tax=Trichobilharzia regenti TaxID=157069 RepID=A0AA85KCH5_TRIRE|nr:unnamed protein product [Trichobilharzia regenti]
MENVILKIAFGATQLSEFASYRWGVIVPLNKKVVCKEFNVSHWPITKFWKILLRNIFRLKLLQRFEESQFTMNRDFIISYAIGIDETKFTILTNFCSYGNLFEWFQQRNSLSVEDVCQTIQYLSIAVDYLHSKKIVHGNIKPHNIFFKTDNPSSVSLVMDFSVLTEINILTNNITKMFIYMSPEYVNLVLNSLQRFNSTSVENIYHAMKELWSLKSPAMDFWSVGVIMHLLTTGKLPFTQHKDMLTFLEDIKTSSPQLNAPILFKVDKCVHVIIMLLLQINVNTRKNVSELTTSNWYYGMSEKNKKRNLKPIIEYDFLHTIMHHQRESENVIKTFKEYMKNRTMEVNSVS